MLQILNKTPFETGLSLYIDQHGINRVCVAVKATFNIPKNNEKITLARKQLPVTTINEYYGEPGKSSIKYPTDIVLGKVSTDIALNGKAYAPGKKPIDKLTTSLQIENLIKKIIVFGDRSWKKSIFDYSMTKPKLFTEMPIIYERAFGGIDDTHKDIKMHGIYDKNPIGRGYCINKKNYQKIKLPNLENPDCLISSIKDIPDQPACYGCIEPVWGDNIKYSGTYNEDWRSNQFPLLPTDFNLRFFNIASSRLIADGLLKGGETVKMENLSQQGYLEFSLPEIKLNCIFRLGNEQIFTKPDIWTVLFEPDEKRFYMVWGTSCDVGKQPSRMKFVQVITD